MTEKHKQIHRCLKNQCQMKEWIELIRVSVVKADLWRIQLQCAFNTSSHSGQNDPGISFEAFSPSINEGDDGAGIHNFIFIIQQGYLKTTTVVTDNYRLHAHIAKTVQGFLTSIPFIQRLAMMESSPQTIMWNSGKRSHRLALSGCSSVSSASALITYACRKTHPSLGSF